MKYLTEATDFTDIKPMKPPGGKRDTMCPKCKGYGSWNLKLNASSKGKHFQSSCTQCKGWGWVGIDHRDITCLHKWEAMTNSELDQHNLKLCKMEHAYICRDCGRSNVVDSTG